MIIQIIEILICGREIIMFDLWRRGKIPKDFTNNIDKSDEVSFANIKKYLGENGENSDVIYREVEINNRSMPVIFIEGLVNIDLFRWFKVKVITERCLHERIV